LGVNREKTREMGRRLNELGGYRLMLGVATVTTPELPSNMDRFATVDPREQISFSVIYITEKLIYFRYF